MRRDTLLAVAGLALLVAASVPLQRVLSTNEWVPGLAITLIVSTGLAVAARRLRIPAAATLALSLVGLLVLMARLHAVDAGPWPTPDALREIWTLARQGFTDIRVEPAPAPPLAGIQVLLTAGAWVIAHVTHETLVRMRRPGATLASGALLWFTPLAVPVPGTAIWPNAVPFFAMAGVILLLEPDPDGSGWTRENTAPRLPAGGVALAGIAALAGLLAPLLSPGYDRPAWIDVSAASEPRGYQPIVDVGDRLHLPEPRDVLSVTSRQGLYLRLAALDTFDGRTWRLGPPGVETFRPDPGELFRADRPLPFETPIADATQVDASVEVLDLENIYVPIPYQVSVVNGPSNANLFYSRQGGFVATGTVEDNELSGQTRVGVKPGFSYTVESSVPTPSYDELAGLGDVSVDAGDPRVALPDNYDDLGRLADQVAADANATTTIDAVLAVQNYFIGPDSDFVYSTDVPELRGDRALRDFLFTTKIGYCEYFATSMAVMLRAAGIPARVAVGFLPGRVTTPAPQAGEPATLTVSTTDAHAWVEVYFDQYGWVRMDPTPRAAALPPTTQNLNPQPSLTTPSTPEPSASATATPTPDTTPTERSSADPLSLDNQTGEAGRSSIPGSGWTWWLLFVLLIVGAATMVWVYAGPWLQRRLAGRDRDPTRSVLAAQRRVLFTAAHLGVGRSPEETVTELALRWARTDLIDEDDAAAFARLSSQAAFGSHRDDGDAVAMQTLETRLVAGLAGAVGSRQRLTAPWRHTASRVTSAIGGDSDA